MSAPTTRPQQTKSRLPRRILILTICTIVGLYMLSFSGRMPTNLGVENGTLAALPDSPNCISTQTTDGPKKMEPVAFNTNSKTALKAIEIAVSEIPRCKVISKSENYLHAEASSLIFRFVDDVEFQIDETNRLIHFRSASRVGHSDMGANRKRMTAVRDRLASILKKADAKSKAGNSGISFVLKTDEEWRALLTPKQYTVTRRHGTERARSGEYWDCKKEGTYQCVCCGLSLFSSETKFKSGTGWPSFWQPIEELNVDESIDNSLMATRTEVHCSRCEAHLGHVFPDGPQPTGLRYCINSASLKLEEKPKE